MTLPGLGGLSLSAVLKQSFREFSDDEMPTYAAALAYRALLALFPFIIFFVALLGFLHVPQLFVSIREQTALLIPAAAMAMLDPVIDGLQTPEGGLLSAGIALAIWSAASGVLALMDALNAAFDVTERRATWKRVLLSIAFTIGMAALLVAAAGLMVIGPEIAGLLAQWLGLQDLFVTVWTWLRWPVLAVLLMVMVSLIYYAGPDTRTPWRFVTPGAIFAVIAWIAASIAFGMYVTLGADYNAVYGSLAAIVILLLYFFLSAVVLLFGAELNAVVQSQARGNRERRPVPDRTETGIRA